MAWPSRYDYTDMIILASKSVSRRAMLDAAGVHYRAVPADLDERAIESQCASASPGEIALTLATAKAQAIAPSHCGQWILGSDSLVLVNGERFDKPEARDQAADHLRRFSGQVMELYSAAVLVQSDAVSWQVCQVARLHWRQLSSKFIEHYLDCEWPQVAGCVGVFRMEAMGIQLFERIEGDHFTILGMPLLEVLAALREAGELLS